MSRRWRGTLYQFPPAPGCAQLLISLRTTRERHERIFGDMEERQAHVIFDAAKLVGSPQLNRDPRALWAYVDAKGRIDYRSLTPDIGLLQRLQKAAPNRYFHIEKVQVTPVPHNRSLGGWDV